MDTQTILCDLCRQRLSIKANQTKVKCPGCFKLNLVGNYSNQLGNNSRSSLSWEENYKGIHICSNGSLRLNLVKKFRNEISPKKSLNSNKLLSLLKSSSSSSSSSLFARPKKRAVVCGVSYNKGKFRLKGTVNDVKNMRDLLITSFQFQPEDIIVLTEEEKEEKYKPTKKNIEKALEWLVKDCQSGDSLVFYFSGHGLRQPDFNGDETDGFDETICPVDFLQQGMIVDNDINSIIVKPLKEGVTLHAIVDACHSGTILDLEYVYNRQSKEWEDNKPPSGASKGTKGGLAICLSACQDNQLASDTSAFTGDTMNGVMTYILAEIVKKHPGLTYGDLLDLIYERIEETRKTDCLLSSKFFRRFFKDKLSQKPLLSSSRSFEVYKEHFLLKPDKFSSV